MRTCSFIVVLLLCTVACRDEALDGRRHVHLKEAEDLIGRITALDAECDEVVQNAVDAHNAARGGDEGKHRSAVLDARLICGARRSPMLIRAQHHLSRVADIDAVQPPRGAPPPTLPGDPHWRKAELNATPMEAAMAVETLSRLGIDAEADSPMVDGYRAYERHCLVCHSTDGTAHRARSSKGLYGRRIEHADGTSVVVDDEYLRASMREPHETFIKDYPPAQPTFGELSTEQIDGVVAFIKALK